MTILQNTESAESEIQILEINESVENRESSTKIPQFAPLHPKLRFRYAEVACMKF